MSSADTAIGTLHTTADAFGQVTSQDSAAGVAQSYSYDALAGWYARVRVHRRGNTLASDGTTSYTPRRERDVVAAAAGTSNALVWTDHHDDVVGQFTSAGTALSGTETYDPWGKVLSKTGMLGSLGYQSEWTDPNTNRVDMSPAGTTRTPVLSDTQDTQAGTRHRTRWTPTSSRTPTTTRWTTPTRPATGAWVASSTRSATP